MHLTGRLTTLSVFLSAFAVTAAAQVSPTRQSTKAPVKPNDPIYAEGYIRPPDAVAKLVDAPRESNFTWGTPSPSRKYLLHALVQPQNLESMGKKHYNLGGWQVDPMGNRARGMTSRSTTGYELLDWAANKVIKVELPPNSRGSTFTSWSPDGGTFAYFAQLPDATHIYFADPATGKSRPLTKTSVNATNVGNFAWTADGKSVVTVLIPDNRGPEPKDPAIAENIRVRVNENNLLKTRNFPDLLDGPYEKELFTYYNMGQLAIIDAKTRVVTKVGEPGMITRIDPSPDAKYFRVTYLDQPFSYILPVSSFGTHEVIIDGSGKVLKLMATRPLREGTATDIVDPNNPDAPQQAGGGFGGRGGGGEADTLHRALAWHPFQSGLMFMRSAIEDSTAKREREVADSIAAADSRAGRGGRGAAGGARGGRGAGGGGAAGGGRGGRGGGRGGAGRGGAAGADTTAGRPDTLFLWQAPFVGDKASILKVLYVTPGDGTINGVQFSDNGRIMFVNETLARTGSVDAIYLDENNARFKVTDGGGGGGAPAGRGGAGGGRGGRGGGGGGGVGLLTKEGSHGGTVVMQSSDGKFVYAAASAGDSAGGAAGAGGRAAGGGRGGRGGRAGANAIEKIEIKTGVRTPVYESTVTDMTEGGVTPLNDDFTKAIATRQTSQIPAESFLIDVASKNATQLTTSKNYWPQITTAIHKTVYAHRPDGVDIRIRVTLPPDWKPGNRMPALFWFYPAEFDSAQAYRASLTGGGRGGAGGPAADTVGGGRGGAGTFPNMGERTMSFVTAAGYALVENDAPIIGTPGKLPNDNYVTDLQWNLEAAVNALVDSGFVDRNKLAIGGHSYGAFSTMNALVHTTLFKAGIAGDGMYNRTLTPDGFQNERRDLWTGQQTYLAMSPMLYADKLQGAILMYHSEEDQNVGTDPISSIRMYQALMANGKTAALYMYPYEDHGPVALESNLDQWARWVAWLDKYVKNPTPPKSQAQYP